MSRTIIVHSLDHARAALAAAAALDLPVTLASAPHAGVYAGPLWFKALLEEADGASPGAQFEAILDCGGEAGVVLAALRLGLKHLRFTGAGPARQRLLSIAAELGATVEATIPSDALNLLDKADIDALCRAYLTAGTRDRS